MTKRDLVGTLKVGLCLLVVMLVVAVLTNGDNRGWFEFGSVVMAGQVTIVALLASGRDGVEWCRKHRPMNRLNGWQRLWVVLAVLWAFAVTVLGLANLPQHAEEIPEEDHSVTRIWADQWRYFDIDGTAQAHAVVNTGVHVDSNTPDSVVVRETDTDGTTHVFAAKTDPKLAANLVRKARRSERISFAASTFVVWLVPLLFLYTLGWSVGWIRRGFHSA